MRGLVRPSHTALRVALLVVLGATLSQVTTGKDTVLQYEYPSYTPYYPDTSATPPPPPPPPSPPASDATPTPTPASTPTPSPTAPPSDQSDGADPYYTSTPASDPYYTSNPGSGDSYTPTPASGGQQQQAGSVEIPYDGLGNNVKWPKWGAAGANQIRKTPQVYTDGEKAVRVQGLKSAREISNILFDEPATFEPRASFMTATWGQMLTHDTLMTAPGTEQWDIAVPRCDANFDTACAGTRKLWFKRAAWAAGSGNSGKPRLPVNLVTAYLDASPIYGSSKAAADRLRSWEGGKLRTYEDAVLGVTMPLIDEPSGWNMNPQGAAKLFLAGDPRTNAQPGVLALHTVFLREHNRLCDEYAKSHPAWSDERTFQAARSRVIAQIQKITMTEYLPVVLGTTLPPYTGYNASIHAGVDVFFGGAPLRYGHSAMNSYLSRVSGTGLQLPGGAARLYPEMFNAGSFQATGAEAYLVGLVLDDEGEVDMRIVTDMRNKLPFFGPSTADASYVRWSDIAALNIQRGRDFGLASLNEMRAHFGLSKYTSFEQVSSNPKIVAALKQAYTNVDDIEAWPGGLAEDPYKGSQLGSVFYYSFREQMIRTRDGDRFWYGNPGNGVDATADDTLANIIKRNTNLNNFPQNPFGVASRSDLRQVAALGGVDYEFTVKLRDDYTLSWSVDGNFVHIQVAASTTGFVGFGIGTSMINVDIVIGWVTEDGKVNVQDYWSENFQPRLDTDWGGSDNLQNVKAEEVEGVTIVSFTRPLAKSDEWDQPILRSGATSVTFSIGGGDSLGYHGANSRGQARVDFFSGEASVTVDNTRWLHGIGMLFGWGFAMPIGAVCARFLKTRKRWWLPAHKILQGFGAASTIPFALTAIVSLQNHGVHPHALLGLVILGLTFAQVLMGNTLGWFMSHPKYASHFGPVRTGHRALGWILILCVQAQIPLGMERINMPNWFVYAFHAWQAVYWTGVLYLQYKDYFPSQGSAKYAPVPALAGKFKRDADADLAAMQVDANGYPVWSVELFEHWVFRGRKLVVIDGYVLDLEEWMGLHPGGPKVFENAMGKDATSLFTGKSGFHRHSKRAEVVARDYRVGVFEDGSILDRSTDSLKPSGGVVPFHRKKSTAALEEAQGARLESSRFRPFVLTESRVLTKKDTRRAYMLVFAPRDPKFRLISGRPGQHVSLRHASAGAIVDRQYTPINLYSKDRELAFIVRMVDDGAMTSHLRNMKIGDELQICSHPEGTGVSISKSVEQLLFLSAGSGITPFLSFLENAIEDELDIPISMIMINQVEAIGLDIVESCAEDLPNMKYLSTLTNPSRSYRGKTGRCTKPMIDEVVSVKYGKVQVWVCGPPAFEESILDMLEEMGFNPHLLASVHHHN